MKRFIKLLSIIIAISMVFCLSGCDKGKSEADYKSAISAHMRNEHNSSVVSYSTFNIKSDGGASAQVNVSVQFEMGGTSEMRAELIVDKDCNIYSCNWCDLGIG